MIKRLVLALVLYTLANGFYSFAQEVVIPDSLSNKRDGVEIPILPDSVQLQNQPIVAFPQLENQNIDSLLKLQPIGNSSEQNMQETQDLFMLLFPKFKPHAYFNLGASNWEMPMIGGVTTFSPTLNYQATKKLDFFGGIGLSQYHNLSYAQSLLAPDWPIKSNIIANGFVGASYRLHERVILHGIYQRSLYNQLPRNLMMFSPGQNMVVTGVSLDVWNGLGVTVDHVWDFDRYGNMRKGFRYSPYIDLPKFIKFLRQ